MNQRPKNRPPLAISMGCPAGIGPEIILKYFLRGDGARQGVIIVGDAGLLRETAHNLGLSPDIRTWQPDENVQPGSLNVLEASDLPAGSVTPGSPDQATGKAMGDYVERAIALCLDGTCGGMVTAPIAKTSLNQAGFCFPGHTELLADRTGAKNVAMMLAGSGLRVLLATIHCALADVPRMLSTPRLIELIQLADESLRHDFGLTQPKIAVAGLNPHASEDGMFGHEEQTIIGPAVAEAAAAGIRVSGPYPPDTVFYRAARSAFDVVLCMYHDQGLIPFKLLHFNDGVNVTLGLPIVRTSVDHGTAYDIAGRGTADYSSLSAAVDMARLIVQNRAGASA
jgi:4-hydroxythreonine-4-phosphate dehydrogenase